MKLSFESVLKEYLPLLSRVASSYEANAHLQQELLQEICLAVWQAIRSFKQQSSIKTYILRVAHNKAVNHVAYHAKQPNSESYCEIEQPLGDPSLCQDKQLEQEMQISQLLQAVRTLPLQSRQVITMSMEGLSYKEIATVCGLTESNVGVIINRARKTLEEQLEHE